MPEVSVPAVRVRVAELHMSAAKVPKPVRVRVPEAHISATSVPKEVRVRPEKAQIEVGKVAARDEDAFATAVLVFWFTSAATDEEETILSVISNVFSAFTKLPFPAEPQDITAGQTPTTAEGVNEYSYQLLAVAVIAAAFTAVAPLGSYTVTVHPAVVVAKKSSSYTNSPIFT